MTVDPNFLVIVELVHPLFERLRDMEPICSDHLPKAVSGVYLFSEGNAPLYVGRTNNIRDRYKAHLTPSHHKAAFAMLLARRQTGHVKATYKKGEGSRDALMNDPTFKSTFLESIDRVRRMEFRFVEEADKIRQCLLEVYSALLLGTPFNDFGNH